MKLKTFIIEFLNRNGLYTESQYIKQIERKGEITAYAKELENVVVGMSDPKRPIVVFGDHTFVQNVSLKPGQQVIVSPYARFTQICNVHTSKE